MAITEHTINDALSEALRKTRHAWKDSNIVRSENTGMLKGNNARPDILVLEPNVSPVVIETEVLPAVTVEKEAISRLGEQIRTNGRTILSALAIRMPEKFRTFQGTQLRAEITKTDELEIALYTGNSPSDCSRWPKTGWMKGGLADLSILVQSSSVPPSVIDEAADILVDGVTEAAGLLGEMSHSHVGAIHKISQELCQEDGEQTRRMAATILANAFMFHEILSGGQDELANIKSLEQLRGSKDGLTKSSILNSWRKILEINYWPIFDIARRIFEVIPTQESKPLIDGLATTADRLLQNRIMRSHDLTGAVFQRLIVDRKFLAAYYTTPASAALLIGLAITPEMFPKGKTWVNPEDVKSLRVADFACGTGTLISTAYHRLCQLHELAGGDAEKLHPDMMANTLVGCDVLPAAAHLTASSLAGAYPAVKYNQSSILTVAYGRQPDGAIALGSLDLLEPQGMFGFLTITAKAAEGMGESEKKTWAELPHASFDVVVMNPPFTRATVHHDKSIDVPNPMFAAFGSTAEEQKLMSDATRRLTKGTSAHGNAGEASIFLVLGDRKLIAGGILALVMPLSLLSGNSWEDSRKLLARKYDELILISIAGASSEDMSFSADTGMGECLVIGRKSSAGSERGIFVNLKKRPSYPLVGASIAEQVRRLKANAKIRCIEDGPTGGTPIHFGDDLIGQVMEAPLPHSEGWNLARIADLSLAQTVYQMTNQQRVWLPGTQKMESVEIPISTVREIGDIGPIHRDINGTNPDGSIRGPFDISPLPANSMPTYPALWAHNADRERTILFDPDSEATPRQGSTPAEQSAIDLKVSTVWDSASHSHFNCDFRFNSQSTGMQFTPRKTIGGTAWIAVKLATIEQEKIFVLWGNTTFGLLLRWWHSNKQQSGRGRIGKQTLQTMPVLDVTALSSTQLSAAVSIFDAFSNQPMLPINEIGQDPVRKELDRQFARRVLNLPEALLVDDGPLDILRQKLGFEPSVRGTKKVQ